MIYDVIIIGGGASGLFAASCIRLPRGARGLIINKAARPGLKLLMSGSGQCNLTHAGDIRDYAAHYGANGKKIRSVLYGFTNHDTCRWFSERGIELYTRADGKVFPASMNAHDILNVLLKEADANGFELINGCFAARLSYSSQGDAAGAASENIFTVFTGSADSQTAPQASYRARRVIMACGGASYPSTGSDGSACGMLSDMGIDIIPLRPALAPLHIEGYPFSALAGNSVRDAAIQLYEGAQPTKHSPSLRGDVLFAHGFLSGPAILDISRYARPGLHIAVSWLPQQTLQDMTAELNALRPGCKKKALTVLCGYLAPKGLSDAFVRLQCSRAGIPADSGFSDLSGAALKNFLKLITDDRFTVSGTAGFSTAMATAGGVSLSETDLTTMQSKKFPGLYFTGEMLDIDGDTGGYNLQFAFSSAARAAASVTDSFDL